MEFFFRIWWIREDDTTEVWYHGFEDKTRGSSEWARNSLSEENYLELFGLDESKDYQVIGRGRLESCGEYDEKLTIIEFAVQELEIEEREEGDFCECGGTFQFLPVENCSCHISPPCHACVENKLRCDNCGGL